MERALKYFWSDLIFKSKNLRFLSLTCYHTLFQIIKWQITFSDQQNFVCCGTIDFSLRLLRELVILNWIKFGNRWVK